MSKATKRKHVTKEILEDYYVPENGEEIVKIICGRGNNLHEVETANGNSYLVSMPTKFRRNVWVKRGDYVIITPIKEGNKVQGEIVYILYDKQIKYLKSERLWPSYFTEETSENQSNVSSGEMKDSKEKRSHDNTLEDLSASSDESDDDDLLENPNHRPMFVYEETSSESEDDNDRNDECENEQLEEPVKKLGIKETE